MKKLLAMLLALIMVLSLAACGTTEEPVEEPVEEPTEEPVEEPAEPETIHLERDDWADDVKKAVNDFVDTYGNTENAYVVFDFDNTTSIFDVEEQLAVYQLQVMAFAFTPDEIEEILFTELGDHDEDRTDLGYGNGSYADWVADIAAAYDYLYTTYGPFTAAGLDADAQATIQADPQWAEFATKMRAMYDLVYDAESPAVAYPWVLYWFTGMTEQEVYDLAYASHTYYGAVETSKVTWTSPADIESKVGVVEYKWTSGTGVSANLVELYRVLDENGIDVWVCSASAIDPIRAAVDAYGLHDYVTGVIAMARCMDEEGKYVNAYDYETGYGWMIVDGEWVKDNLALGAQTQGVGKVEAINAAIYPKYGVGPLAGFMDSTGDFNFCTEYENLKLVINFNRANRKPKDGGGIISAIAVYQKDTLGYDLATANAAGDTLYVLQGREENGLRGLRASNATMLLGATEEKLLANDDVQALIQYMIDNNMTTADAINLFAIKGAEEPIFEFSYGCVKTYAGYHNIG